MGSPHSLSRELYTFRKCVRAPRIRLYHKGKPIRYALTSLTIRAVRPASVARARRLASSSRDPAAASCSAGLLSPPSSNAVARGRDSLAPHAEPRADLSSALAQQRVACVSETAPATQAHLKALDGDDVVSVGPAGVITSSWRCSARAEHRAAADRTGLLHSLAAAARSVPASQRLQSGRRDVSLRTGSASIRALSVAYV
eukprot:scaffold5556_cov62-Phaeocystis_antarctica.AAC.2